MANEDLVQAKLVQLKDLEPALKQALDLAVEIQTLMIQDSMQESNITEKIHIQFQALGFQQLGNSLSEARSSLFSCMLQIGLPLDIFLPAKEDPLAQPSAPERKETLDA